MSTSIDNPILNSPYEQPDRHYAIGPQGPTGEIQDGRRPSESFIPIAVSKKGKKGGDGSEQEGFDFDATGERREKNSLINDIRRDVDKWRRDGQYAGVTPISPQAAPALGRPDPREPRHLRPARGGRDRHLPDRGRGPTRAVRRLAQAARAGERGAQQRPPAGRAQDGHRLRQDHRHGDAHRLADAQQAVRPARRAVHQPVPRSSRPASPSATASGCCCPRTRRTTTTCATWSRPTSRAASTARASSSRTTTRSCSRTPRRSRASPRTPACCSRATHGRPVQGDAEGDGQPGAPRTSGADKQQIMVLNDEAHHCYLDKPDPDRREASTKEQNEENEQAGVWFSGLQAIAKHVGIKQIYDLSATPFYLSGSGYNEGYIFPWTVSDFSLMDAIESGIVKVPRTPVDDDADDDLVTYLRLWDHVGTAPAEARSEGRRSRTGSRPRSSKARCAACTAATRRPTSTGRRSSSRTARRRRSSSSSAPTPWSASSSTTGSPARRSSRTARSSRTSRATSPLFSNVVDGQPVARPRTHPLDSAQLESGEALKDDFKKAAGARDRQVQGRVPPAQPGRRRRQAHRRGPAARGHEHRRQEGQARRDVRCVVSVSMLTEGWDANTVTHILGVRAFGSQLLCEQVVGRGLRRRNYAANDEGHFEPEYANVYGIPFQFISSDKPIVDPATAQAVDRGASARRSRAPADHLPEARRLPGRAPRRGHLARPRRRAGLRDRPQHRADLGRDGRRRRQARARARATRLSTARSKSRSRSPSASSTSSSRPSATSGPGSSRSWWRSARTGSSSASCSRATTAWATS